ncbi:MAG: GvpL/GvpF family gas vesicle protein, partial [Vulcanimicrobiaceae bacterium]
MALYGVATADLVGRRFTLDGQRVQAIRFGRVALLISYVEPDAFTPDVLDRRRHEDGAWMQQQASRHERIIERASVHARVLPQPLLTVFPNPQSLARAARLQSSRWQRSLTRVGEAREYALHVYAGPHAAPGGDPYLLRVSARAVRSQRPLAAPVLPPAVADHL